MENEKRQALIAHINKHLRYIEDRKIGAFEWDKNNAEVYRIALAALNSEHIAELEARTEQQPVATVLNSGRQMSAGNKTLIVSVLVENGSLSPGDRLFANTVPPSPAPVAVKLPDERFRYGESDYDDGEDYRRIIDDGRREFLRSGKGKALVRMGLVSMKPDPVVFWFEKYQKEAV